MCYFHMENASEMSIFVFNNSVYPDLQDKMYFPHIPPALLSNILWNAAQGWRNFNFIFRSVKAKHVTAEYNWEKQSLTPDLYHGHKEQLLAAALTSYEAVVPAQRYTHSPPIPKEDSSAQSTAAPSLCPFSAAQRKALGQFHEADKSLTPSGMHEVWASNVIRFSYQKIEVLL